MPKQFLGVTHKPCNRENVQHTIDPKQHEAAISGSVLCKNTKWYKYCLKNTILYKSCLKMNEVTGS